MPVERSLKEKEPVVFSHEKIETGCFTSACGSPSDTFRMGAQPGE